MSIYKASNMYSISPGTVGTDTVLKLELFPAYPLGGNVVFHLMGMKSATLSSQTNTDTKSVEANVVFVPGVPGNG